MGDQTDIDNQLLSRIIEAFIVLSNEKTALEGINPLAELEQKIVDSTR